MRRQITTLLTLLFAATAAPASAQDAFALFKQFLSHPNATMTFRQTSFDSDDVILDENSGTLAYQRPSKFRLEYDSPVFPLVVSDGTLVWYYEEELEQAIVQPIQSAQKSGLWQVLATGDIAVLEQHYVISAGIAGEFRSLNAESAQGGGDVKSISLRFDAASGVLRQVFLVDHFGSRVLMEIDQIQYAAPDELFVFRPPAGTDVIQAQ